MSGYKQATVTISQEEYQRLHNADMKKRFKDYSRSKRQVDGNDATILNLIQQLEERENLLQNMMSSFDNSSAPVDEEILQSIRDQNAINYEQIATALRNSYGEIQGSLDDLSLAFSREMQADRERNYEYLQAIFQNQEIVYERELAKEDAAHQWMNQCILLTDFIQSQFDHERFVPGKLGKLLRNLNLAENNLYQGFSETCLQQAQQVFVEMTDLNLELEQLHVQWHTLFSQTYQEVNELIDQISENSNIRALGLQGEELPNYVDLDYWSNGRFHQLLEHCRQLAQYMYQDQNILAFEDINRVQQQILPAIRESFETIVFNSRLQALNSQLRMNIAEKALLALENHGFVLDEAGYTNNDMRSQFNARLECPDGSQVTIQVIPTEKSVEELSNELVVITTHPTLKTDHEARLQWEELSATLTQYQLRVSRPEVYDTPTTATNDQREDSNKTRDLFTLVEK